MGRHAGRLRRLLSLVLLAVLATAGLSACSPMATEVRHFGEQFQFGDGSSVSDSQVTGRMPVTQGSLGPMIGDDEINGYIKHTPHGRMCGKPTGSAAGNPAAGGNLTYLNYDGVYDPDNENCVIARQEAIETLRAHPEAQCTALEGGVQEESTEQGKWNLEDGACVKKRKLTWLEATLWNMYKTQSDKTIDWLTTDRNTMLASASTVSTLESNATPDYDRWNSVLNKYLPVFGGLVAVAAAVSLIVLGARVVANTREGLLGGEDHRLMDRMCWICLGVFMCASCASIALTVFRPTRASYHGDGFKTVTVPWLTSWEPGAGSRFYVSDWIRMQVDPFLIIAAVLGVLAAGWKLVTTQEGRELVPLGKAMMWAVVTSLCLAGAVTILTGTVDEYTSDILRRASDMMAQAWETNALSANQFFSLDPLLASLLCIIMWICNLVGKVFTYLRAGLLPILVGVAPVFAALSWNEHGRQGFGKILGWLVAFLLYKPVASLVMAAGSAIMTTAGPGDDSQVITLTLTVMVVVMLPAMVRTIAPAVAASVSGGAVAAGVLGTVGAAAGSLAGSGVKAGGKGLAKGGVSAVRKAGSGLMARLAPSGAKRAAGAAPGATGAAFRTGAAAGSPPAKPAQAPAGQAAASPAAGQGLAPSANGAPSGAKAGTRPGPDGTGRQSAPSGPAGSAAGASMPAGRPDVPAQPPSVDAAPDGADRSAGRREGGVKANGF